MSHYLKLFTFQCLSIIRKPVLLASMSISLLVIALDWLPLTDWLPHAIASSLIFWNIIPLLISLLYFLILLVFLIFTLISFAIKKFKDIQKVKTAITLVLALTTMLSVVVSKRTSRKWAFSNLEKRSERLVESIKRYEKDLNRAPSSLNDLVPNYIPEVPSTKMSAYPSYEYEVLEKPKQMSFEAWYDLGSRNGLPMAGLWKYHYGNGNNAILVVNYFEDGKIQSLTLDRSPDSSSDDLKFNKLRWNEEPHNRLKMIRDFYRNHYTNNMNLTELKQFLGEPNEFIENKTSPWELRVNCGSGGLNWDVFFYWPTEDYPENIYGGYVERIGKWAYVYE